MKSVHLSPILVLVTFLMFSCNKSDNATQPISPTARDTSLIPLAVGNQWQYSDSAFYSTDSVIVYRYTWSVVAKQSIFSMGDSVLVYVFRISYEGISPFDVYYGVTEQGLVQYGQLESDTAGHYSLQSLVLKFPLQPGDTWAQSHGDYADQKTCLSVDTSISTPSGSFNCYLIRTGPGSPWYGDEYYKLNLGLVGGFAQTSVGSNTSIQKTTLLSYVLH